MDAHEIVVHEIDRHHVRVVLGLQTVPLPRDRTSRPLMNHKRFAEPGIDDRKIKKSTQFKHEKMRKFSAINVSSL
jgi:hypothetical protein